jgi:phosphoribosylaminoimidazolecarboxamide formyltransferase/IMP cyclohydrolase
MSESYRVKTAPGRVRIERVIVSVSDKRNLEALVEGLLGVNSEVRFYSTGGTYRRIRELLGNRAESHLTSISEYTGQEEMAGGLVKTLDYRIYLGLLSDAENEEHRRHLEAVGAVPFDMTVVNLYPFSAQVSEHPHDLEGARQNIDIGGPTLLRASAKNFLRVAVVSNPDRYRSILAELEESGGTLALGTRFRLAREAFAHTASYDNGISSWLDSHADVSPEAVYTIDETGPRRSERTDG